MVIMIRIKKGNNITEVTETNWNNGWLKQNGWVEDKVITPKKETRPEAPEIKAIIESEADTSSLNVPQDEPTELELLEMEYKALAPAKKRTKEGQALKGKIAELKAIQ